MVKFAGANFITHCFEVSHVTETSISALTFGFFFPENMGAVSNEHGKKFHHDVSQTEKRYSGMWSPDMLYDYCRSYMGDTNW